MMPVSPSADTVQLVPLENEMKREDAASPVVEGIPTPQASDEPSDTHMDEISILPSTPSPVMQPESAQSQKTPTQPIRTTRPVVPVIPIMPKAPGTSRRPHSESLGTVSTSSKVALNTEIPETSDVRLPNVPSVSNTSQSQVVEPTSETIEDPKPVPPPPPKSWADLVRKNAPPSVPAAPSAPASLPNGLYPSKNETLSDVLNTIGPDMGQSSSKIAFLQPRGLVNTGNMCYMNSVSTESVLAHQATDLS